ncbi:MULTISPECIES: enoyl-CoA hydratase [Burkholderia]|uniref:Enoyl-CoA hydratase/isomerase n=1 Tax=Burkholderia orbicola (strain MC0-3) TaxID=406425 RepID=B1KCJ1_BURO0|nr:MULTISPECIES: enoyl-CoA hydratase [Burkholderia]ACA95938.1 Enoyl-CoA hydratase/isomerase [Burkholderia orbicola MC0-3]KWU23494.1 enoyl-CoA hydratase [Burkholderia cenocepacia]MBY4798431.1 enoyl-CoA hydratase [Burkholderia cepacia]MCA8088016.1 enoyl-CoA hydratase [Burkholderia cenocepacia]RQV54762.1 enoyl-CoA hydratase [Burkholderia cenocepacia]
MDAKRADLLDLTQEGVVLTLTLNRPDARNALNLALTEALVDAIHRFEADESLRVLIVTGADPAFCAGLDLNDFSAPDAPRARVAEMIDMWARISKPVIAAVNGAAVTGGLELAMGCDFIIASERARFADTHTKIGALAGGGMTARLPHIVGSRWAKQFSFTSEPIDAATALRIGLVNEVLAHDQLMERAAAVANTIASRDPDLVATVKRVIDQGALATLEEALRIEKEALAERRQRGGMAWQVQK